MSNSPAAPNDSPTPSVPWWQSALACLWLAIFAGCFYQFDLPNSAPKVNRATIWQQLPALLVNAVDPPEPSAKDLEARQLWKHAGWRFLPQRFGLYGVTLAILTGAWAWGNLLLRVAQVPLACWSVERTFFALVCGLSVVSLLTLACGLAGQLSPWVLGGILAAGLLCELIARVLTFSSHDLADIGRCVASLQPKRMWPLFVCVPFLMCYIGGAFLPEIDFDVKEYHFGGPKEWYQAGRISFLSHNIYTSFPFLTEMLTLLGMVLYGDWYWGALAGKGVLMTFGPLTALGIYAAGRRWFSPQAGAWAAVIHLSTPWIYRISIIAYAEGGLACYLFASLLAVMYFLDRQPTVVQQDDPAATLDHGNAWVFLAGFLSGSAMACKYPGAVSVVIPLGLVLLVRSRTADSGPTTRPSWLATAVSNGIVFTCGVLLAMGPWLLKNLYETGNPVYPLLYNVFGGTDLTAELNLKWKHGHSPDHHQLFDIAVKLMDVTLKSDWLSPLLFGLAPLALFVRLRSRGGISSTSSVGTAVLSNPAASAAPFRGPTLARVPMSPSRRAVWLWVYVGYLFATWWLLTHRIDRFWVPLIPVVSLLAGIGATWNNQRWWRWVIRIIIVLGATFNLGFMTSSLCGYNAYLLDLQIAAEQTARITSPEIVMLNSQLPPGSKVLCVGEAELFDARFPYVYNTVFDKSLFEEWCGAAEFPGDAAERPLKSAADIRQILQSRGITHVFVNWQEILRYRLTYGYTDFVNPRNFERLQAAGILDAGWSLPGAQLLENMRVDERAEVQRWAPELIQSQGGQAVFKTFDVYRVK